MSRLRTASARAFGTELGTWQGRLPRELRLAGIATLEEANRFLREHILTSSPQVRGGGRTESKCLSAFEPVGSGLGVHGANRAYRRQGQHRR